MSITPVQTDYGAFFEGLSIQEMIYEARKWLGVGETDTTRYTDADVLKALNFGQERFAYLSGCLSMPTIIVCKANWQNYRLPFNALRVLGGVFYKGESRYDYQEMELITKEKMKRVNPYFRGEAGDPLYLFPSYRAGNVLLVGISPIPTTDGTSWDGSEYGVVTSATGFTNVGNITGTHKAGYANSAFLVDAAGRNFNTLNVQVGHQLFNVTKDASAQITAIGNQDATGDKLSGTLSGGNDWDEGDSFQIPMSEYGVVIDATDEEAYILNSYLGTISNIYGKTGNLLLDVARKPLALSLGNLNAVTEIPAAHHEAVVGYAVWWLGHRSYKGVIQGDKAAEGLAVFNQHLGEYGHLGEVVEEKPYELPANIYQPTTSQEG